MSVSHGTARVGIYFKVFSYLALRPEECTINQHLLNAHNVLRRLLVLEQFINPA